MKYISETLYDALENIRYILRSDYGNAEAMSRGNLPDLIDALESDDWEKIKEACDDLERWSEDP